MTDDQPQLKDAPRPVRVRIRLTEEGARQLDELAHRLGAHIADTVEIAVRDMYSRRRLDRQRGGE